jgi:hypothetical protein
MYNHPFYTLTVAASAAEAASGLPAGILDSLLHNKRVKHCAIHAASLPQGLLLHMTSSSPSQ